jgi:hypothetical protein
MELREGEGEGAWEEYGRKVLSDTGTDSSIITFIVSNITSSPWVWQGVGGGGEQVLGILFDITHQKTHQQP